MKNGQVIKSVVVGADDEMALINSYSRRELTKEDVYIFSVALCDNDVDRDFERFTVESLFELEKLFVGKTGIIDHQPTAKNQKARIISCRVEGVAGEVTSLGDQLFRLTARAYIPQTDGNRELIEAIEAGIVKEVSVGCSMGRTVCSICGNDMRSPMCNHRKGHEYEGELCFGELTDPRDAYEFSFVAVPAQRAAGVIKSVVKEKNMTDIRKALETEGEVTLSESDVEKLREYIGELERDSEYAEAYREQLREKLRSAIRDKGLELDYAVEKCIIEKLSISEALALLKAMDKKDRKAVPQLGLETVDPCVGNTEFRI